MNFGAQPASAARNVDGPERSGGEKGMSTGFHFTKWLLAALIVTAMLSPGMPCKAQSKDRDLTELSLEDLMNVRVTSAAKREEKLSQTAAAIYVITGDDIRHSGVTTLADALRLAPGVQVSQMSSNAWAVTIRGFGALYSNKLLVLIDGRSVYSPIFSGVLWNRQDTFLDDIDRIEVIRGPGASLWGSNAVNGVINIITKHAKETQGAVVTAGAGDHEKAFGGLRYGGSFGPDFYYRGYGKYFARTDLSGPYPATLRDNWDFGRGGMRADWDVDAANAITVEGEYLRGTPGPILSLVPVVGGIASQGDATGANGLIRWKHAFASGSEMTWQLYYDHSYRPEFPFVQKQHSVDLDFQHSILLGDAHQLVWGGGVRSTSIHSDVPPSSAKFISIPSDITLHLFSGFVQDEITLVPNRLQLTAGIRIEDNDYTDVEAEPTLRMLYTPSTRQAFWAAVSRAVRIPNVSETQVNYVVTAPSVPFPVRLGPNQHPRSEEMIAYEAGYRVAPMSKMTLDIAGFYNHYDNLTTNTPAFMPGVQPMGLMLQWSNGALGQTYGGEVGAAYAPWQRWKLQGSYSLFRGAWAASRADRTALLPFQPGYSPAHQFQIRSALNLSHSVRMDTSFFYVGAWADAVVPWYPRLDSSLEWQATRNLQLQLVVENALQPRHVEFFNAGLMRPGEYVERSVYGKMTWHF